ncbi:MAG: ABC transporter permease [Actinobacteria bacterium]|nr:ABC transporter permease [Actinomycetota bacterium]
MNNNIQNNIAADAGTGTSRAADIFKKQEVFLAIVIVVLGVIVSIVNPLFLSLQNFFNIVLAVSITGVATIGLSLVFISGEFDLTLGAMMSLQCILFATFATKINPAVGIILTLLFGLVFGAVNGFFVTRIRAHSFIITLALLSVYSGLALVISKGNWVSMVGTFMVFKNKIFNIIPNPAIVFVIALIIFAVVYRYTNFGRILYAIGGNPQAAYLSGLKVKNYKILAFTIAAVLYSVASIVLVSMLGTAQPTSGDVYMLEAFAAAVVGGIMMGGGKGNMLGLFLGVIVFGLINNALIIMNVDPFWRDVVVGAIILAAVGVSGFGASRK